MHHSEAFVPPRKHNHHTSVFNMICILDRFQIAQANNIIQILDTQPALYFRLQQQKLIEYIRQGRIAEALEFAQRELAPRGEERPEILLELERTMALLAFESTTTIPPAIAELLSPAQRLKTAGELNAAILEKLSHGKEAKVVALIKLLCWGEDALEERAEFPKVSAFGEEQEKYIAE